MCVCFRWDQQEKKVESDAAENEKDASTEKESKDGGGDAGGEAAPIAASSPVAADKTASEDSDAGNKTLENGSTDETLNDSKTAEDSNKKPKKVKKKWSFRSISFSKKDKQKPAKKDKDGEEKVNGDCEKVPEEVSFFFNFLGFLRVFCQLWSPPTRRREGKQKKMKAGFMLGCCYLCFNPVGD